MPMLYKSKDKLFVTIFEINKLKKIFFILFIYDFTDVKSNVSVVISILIANRYIWR